VLLCLVGSALVLLAVRQSWVAYPVSHGLTIRDVRTHVAGREVAGAAQALSLVGFAGVVAIAATKRRGRVLVGALVALAGVLVVADVVSLMARGLGHELARSGCSGLCIISDQQYNAGPTWLWPVLTLLGGLVMAAGGALVAVRGRRWAALSSSYQVPAARETAAEPTDKSTWDALDRGDDPTV
jgi:uncharacterized membrane protein (TIGR02234 family)